MFFVVYPYPIASDVLEEGLNALGKKDKEARPTPTLPDMSPDTRSDEKTDVVRGQISVKHPPPPPAVSAVDGLDEVMHITFRSFMFLLGWEQRSEGRETRKKFSPERQQEMNGFGVLFRKVRPKLTFSKRSGLQQSRHD